ncbi:MAG: hypothetical protein GY820_39105 [Gammaproteobacteria bacterium]|nr:hypothetical protein [Gammaproteobacteria bacterium]
MIDIEKSIIGSILFREKLFLDVADILTVDDFTTKAGKESWLLISDTFGKDKINLQSIYLKSNHKEWILDCSENTFPDTSQSARELVELSKKRRITEKLNSIINELKATPLKSSRDCMDDLMRFYQSELDQIKLNCDISSVADRFESKQAEYKKDGYGVSTGFDCFDNDYITYRPGHLWVIGAWTSVGKTTYMIEALRNVAMSSRVAVFSTEMTEEQNVAKILACLTGYNSNAIMSGRLMENHDQHAKEQLSVIRKADIHLYDRTRTTRGITTQCRKLNMVKPLDIVFIDFIQNLDTSTGKKYDAMSNAAITLQNLAHELRCTIICLSQLPNHAGREDKGILEFKGAGEIAAAADIGVLMKRATDDNKVILFDIRKNRHGACKKYLFRFTDGWTGLTEEGEIKE